MRGRLHLQGTSQPHVLVVVRIRPAVAVSEQSVLGDVVLVGPWPPGDGGSCRDREGDAGSHDCRLEDALGSHEWDLATFEDEALFQLRSGDYPAVVASVPIKESKGSRPDGLVVLIAVDQGRLLAAGIVTSHSVGSRGRRVVATRQRACPPRSPGSEPIPFSTDTGGIPAGEAGSALGWLLPRWLSSLLP